MQVVCEATQSSNLKIQVAALQNLVKILSLYYDYMEYYMGPALFAVRASKDLFVVESRSLSFRSPWMPCDQIMMKLPFKALNSGRMCVMKNTNYKFFNKKFVDDDLSFSRFDFDSPSRPKIKIVNRNESVVTMLEEHCPILCLFYFNV